MDFLGGLALAGVEHPGAIGVADHALELAGGREQRDVADADAAVGLGHGAIDDGDVAGGGIVGGDNVGAADTDGGHRRLEHHVVLAGLGDLTADERGGTLDQGHGFFFAGLVVGVEDQFVQHQFGLGIQRQGGAVDEHDAGVGAGVGVDGIVGVQRRADLQGCRAAVGVGDLAGPGHGLDLSDLRPQGCAARLGVNAHIGRPRVLGRMVARNHRPAGINQRRRVIDREKALDEIRHTDRIGDRQVVPGVTEHTGAKDVRAGNVDNAVVGNQHNRLSARHQDPTPAASWVV